MSTVIQRFLKNSLLILLALIVALVLSEILIRVITLWIPLTLDKRGSWLILSNQGYSLNKNSGESLHQFDNYRVHYHFYPPHLRDTPIDKKATPILVLGDSFAFGWLLPWNKTFIYRLQQKANNTFGKQHYQFLNAATAAWGTANYLAYLEAYGEKISPKFVLVFLNTDDIGRSIKRNLYQLRDPKIPLLTENFHPSWVLVAAKKCLTSTLGNWIFEHSALIQFLRANASRFFVIDKGTIMNDRFLSKYNKEKIIIPSSPDLPFQNEFAIRYGDALFLRINDWCKKHHAKLLVVTTGFNAFYPADANDPTQVFLSQANLFFTRENIPYDDIAIPFKKAIHGKKFQIPEDEHPNELGAETIAALTWPWIKEHL